MLKLSGIIWASAVVVLGCAGTEKKAAEPVAAEAPGAAPAVVAAPQGESGEAAPKPAEEAPAAEVAVEKSVPAPVVEQKPAEVRAVVSWGLNVRKGPGMSFAAVRQLQRGELVTILGQEGIWARISETEYVSTKFLANAQAPATAHE